VSVAAASQLYRKVLSRRLLGFRRPRTRPRVHITAYKDTECIAANQILLSTYLYACGYRSCANIVCQSSLSAPTDVVGRLHVRIRRSTRLTAKILNAAHTISIAISARVFVYPCVLRLCQYCMSKFSLDAYWKVF